MKIILLCLTLLLTACATQEVNKAEEWHGGHPVEELSNALACHSEDAAAYIVVVFHEHGIKGFNAVTKVMVENQMCSRVTGPVVLIGEYTPVQHQDKLIKVVVGYTPKGQSIWLFQLLRGEKQREA